MIVKMLTHVHMLVYTLWCGHTLRRRWSLKGRKRMGSSLPPAELARQDSALFEKMKCIFSITLVVTLEKSHECSSLRNTHHMLALEAPDAEVVCPVCCGARFKHRTLHTGCRVAPVHASGAI